MLDLQPAVSQFTALSLSRSPVRHRADALHTLAERLLDLLSAHAPADAAVRADTFRTQLSVSREALRFEEDEDRVTYLTRDIAAACERFLDRTRRYHSERDGEIAGLVQVLGDAIGAVRGESLRFEQDLIRSTAEMGRLLEIEDIRELKRGISREVESLRASMADRQAHDAQHFDRLTSRVLSLEQSLVRARVEAATDALTSLPNRGAFDVALRGWLDRGARDGSGFSLAMVDLDDFKRINDTCGHQVGDRVIMTMAQVLQAGAIDGEVVARFGGEEFALLLTPATASKAHQRLTAVLDRLPPAFEYEDAGARRHISFSFSAGVTAWVAGDTPESIVKRADEALYDAKRRGKKRVEMRPRSLLRGLLGGG